MSIPRVVRLTHRCVRHNLCRPRRGSTPLASRSTSAIGVQRRLRRPRAGQSSSSCGEENSPRRSDTSSLSVLRGFREMAEIRTAFGSRLSGTAHCWWRRIRSGIFFVRQRRTTTRLTSAPRTRMKLAVFLSSSTFTQSRASMGIAPRRRTHSPLRWRSAWDFRRRRAATHTTPMS